MSKINEEIDIPVWFAMLMICVMLCVVFVPIIIEGERVKKERKEYLRESFSRMSENPEIQEAYDEIQ